MQIPLIDIAHLLGAGTGTGIRHKFQIPLQQLQMQAADPPLTSPLELEVKITRAPDERLLVEIVQLQGKLRQTCVRCLDNQECAVTGISANAYYHLHPVRTASPDIDEMLSIIPEKNAIDITSLVTAEIWLQLDPFFVCRADCLGLCAECGEKRENGNHEHPSHTKANPFAGLREKLGGKEKQV